MVSSRAKRGTFKATGKVPRFARDDTQHYRGSLYWLGAFLRFFQLIAALVAATCGSWRKRSAPPAPAKTYRLPLEITQTVGSASRRTPFDMFMVQEPPNCGAYFSGLALNRSRCRALAKR